MDNLFMEEYSFIRLFLDFIGYDYGHPYLD